MHYARRRSKELVSIRRGSLHDGIVWGSIDPVERDRIVPESLLGHLRSENFLDQIDVGWLKRPGRASRRDIGAEHQRVWTFPRNGFQRRRHIELQPAEAGGLHLAAGRDHVEQGRPAGFGHADMVNAELW